MCSHAAQIAELPAAKYLHLWRKQPKPSTSIPSIKVTQLPVCSLKALGVLWRLASGMSVLCFLSWTCFLLISWGWYLPRDLVVQTCSYVGGDILTQITAGSSIGLSMIFHNGAMLTVQLAHRKRSPVSRERKQGACQEFMVYFVEKPLKTCRIYQSTTENSRNIFIF